MFLNGIMLLKEFSKYGYCSQLTDKTSNSIMYKYELLVDIMRTALCIMVCI